MCISPRLKLNPKYLPNNKNGGYLDAESAIRSLYPDLDDAQVQVRALALEGKDGVDQDTDQDTSTV